jgi:hypothetical protein
MLLVLSALALAQDAPAEVMFGPEPPPAVALGPEAPAELVAPPEAAVATPPVSSRTVETPTALPAETSAMPMDEWLQGAQTGESAALSGPDGITGTWWFLPLALGVAGAAWLTREKLKKKLDSKGETMTVLSRTNLTGKASVVLMEVPTADGGHRRLLVGVGDGPPSLVADLGGDLPDFEVQVEDSETIDEPSEPVRVPDLAPPTPVQVEPPAVIRAPPSPAAPKQGLTRRFQTPATTSPPQHAREGAAAVTADRPRKAFTGRFNADDLADEADDAAPITRPKAWTRQPRANVVEEVLSTRDVLERRL